ncbi:hypothetical protein Y032_0117g634 [Ancylostoma ceylanicum]|uniref:Uncharacterized protein n=1 Tax=Ancylostoma ceylanicum TaxID=53326 RepID=A0A016TB23_9BILA|nr:hypothetical protein Y032_0117g634 [Ancylostoma ceylanicum]
MIIVEGMCSESSVEGSWPSSSSSSNLSRLRSGLGHSDPQISASSSHTPSPKGSLFFASLAFILAPDR